MAPSPAVERSTVLSTIRTALASSRLRASLQTAARTAQSTRDDALAGSRLATTARRATDALSRTATTSTTRHLTTHLSRYVRASFLYRWLTAEPEPEVIVIDLGDTVSLSPVIALLDRFVGAIVPASHRSTVHSTLARTGDEIQQRPIRALSLVTLAATTTFLLASTVRDTLTGTTVAFTGAVILLSLLGLRSTRSWAEVRECRPVQLLVAALEPPEPPGEYTSRPDSLDEDETE